MKKKKKKAKRVAGEVQEESMSSLAQDYSRMGSNVSQSKSKKPTNEEKTRSEIRNILERKHPKVTDKKPRLGLKMERIEIPDKTGTERAADELHREAVKPKPTTTPPKFGGGGPRPKPFFPEEKAPCPREAHGDPGR